MQNNLSDFEYETIQRPTLLTVLCILSFIGSGWSIMTNIWAFSTASKTAKIIEKRISMRSDSSVSRTDSSINKDSVVEQAAQKKKVFLGEKIMASVSKMMTADNIRKTALGKIVASLLTLVGALLMWFQKRKGFYFYILGVIFGLMVPFYLYGGNLIALGMASLPGFFGLIFIALYALNLKTMK